MSDFTYNISPIFRTLIVGICAYIGLVFFLRISGKRTLSKWNAFDLVATVALGSSLATSFLSKDVSLPQGLLAFALLIALQFLITWFSTRSSFFEHLVKARPALLLYKGKVREEVLRRERVTMAEMHAALRGKGITDVLEVGAVILETDGSFSIVTDIKAEGPGSALENVEIPQG